MRGASQRLRAKHFRRGRWGVPPENTFMKKTGTRKVYVGAGAAIAAIMMAAALYLAVPTVGISPADGLAGVSPGEVDIDSSPFSKIGKIAVYADDRLLALEYNLGEGNLSCGFGLKPGQKVRVEAKVASPIGLTREFVATFTTVDPLILEEIAVDGEPLRPGQKISPQPALAFIFNKPVSHAAVSLDGSEPIGLEVDAENPARTLLPPMVSLKQGSAHVARISAEARDAAFIDQQEIRTLVVRPLTFYGMAGDEGGKVRVELGASVAFRDPEAVRRASSTDLPGAEISVEKQKIIILGDNPGAGSYTITVGSAEGIDGSFLETPLALTLGYQASESRIYAAGATAQGPYRGYIYTGGGTSGQLPAGGGTPAESGPPPGWPSCCPWPPG